MREGRPEAADVIWTWPPASVGSEEDSPARARVRGLLEALAPAAVGVLFLLYWRSEAAWVAFSIAGFVAFAALVSPLGLLARVHGLAAATGRVVGVLLAWAFLVPVFYLFFLPFGLLFRRGRRDRLTRFYEPDAPTYWSPHGGSVTSASTSREHQY